MKKFYPTFLIFLSIIFSSLFSQAQITTTRSLTWNAGSQNWPTSATSVSWTNPSNWVISGTSTVPATGPTSGDKLIIPTTGSPVITITSTMAISGVSDFILEVDGNGSIFINKGLDFSISGTNIGFFLNAVNAGKGLSLAGKQGSTATTFTMNGVTKAYNNSPNTTLSIASTTTNHADGSHPALTAGTTIGFGGFVAGLLPVIISDLRVNIDVNHKINIAWTTQQEINTRIFIVERSSDGKLWKTIASIDAAGNSSTIKQYQVLDNAPENGINIYRIETIDMDGASSYSMVKDLRLNGLSKIGLYPNPATDHISISLADAPTGNWSIQLYNNAGQLMLQRTFEKNNTNIILQVGQLSAGNYTLQIVNGSATQSSVITIGHH